MRQAANIISFPVDATTTDFLGEFTGSERQRLENVAIRLLCLKAMLQMMRQDPDASETTCSAFEGVEIAIKDCIALIDVQPLDESK